MGKTRRRGSVIAAAARYVLAIVMLLLVCLALGVAAAPAASSKPGRLNPKVRPELAAELRTQDEVSVIVSLRVPAGPLAPVPFATQERVLRALDGGDFQLQRRYDAVPALSGVVRSTAIERLASLPDVEAVSPDLTLRGDLNEARGLLGADAVHTLGVTGGGVTVAVLDTGIDTDHPDLADDLLSEHCFLGTAVGPCHNGMAADSGPGAAEDDNGHGTHVSGIITSQGTVAPVGIAPDASIRSYKILNASGTGLFSDTLAAYDDIIANQPDVDVINMSLGDGGYYVARECDTFFPAFTTAVATTRAMGTVSFAAAGNSASKAGISFPGCVTDIVSVGAVYDANVGSFFASGCLDATTAADQVTCFSQSEPALDVLAPGALITSTFPGGGTATLAGTSMATPAAAATAALLLGSEPLLTAAQAEARLRATGVPVTDAANGVTTCRIDIYEAVANDGGPVCSSSQAAPPPNDPFDSPIVIPGTAPYTTSQDTLGATLQAGEPLPCGQIGNTVWYTFTAPSNATVTVDSFGSDYDTALAAYSGSTLSNLTNLACNDDSAATLQSEIQFGVAAGQAYHIQAGGFLGSTGELVLHASFGPPPTPTPTKQPPPGDTDGDGCADQRENGANPVGGGGRSYLTFWDFFDTPNPSGNPLRNRVVDIDDVLRVAGRFGTTGDANGDPLSLPPMSGYHTAFDRTFVGPDPWDLGPADGGTSIDEIFWVAAQFAHNCT